MLLFEFLPDFDTMIILLNIMVIYPYFNQIITIKSSKSLKLMATCLELVTKKGGFVTLFSFSLHSNVDISVKWIGIVMKVVLF